MANERSNSSNGQEQRWQGRGLNQVTLVGRLARDPELRATNQGVPRAWFVLAVARAVPEKDGERDADFVNIVAWRQLASVVGEHLKKGRLIGLTGRLRVDQFEDDSGAKRSATEVVADQIVFLDAPRKEKTEKAAPA
ncbi:MAG TPA: single-stranded DNA-binding protein [bacterium]|jgi:single-strand DNA-binding protein